MVLHRRLELLWGPEQVSLGPAATSRIIQYASFLAGQGSLAAALSYLPRDCAQVSGALWRESSHLKLACSRHCVNNTPEINII